MALSTTSTQTAPILRAYLENGPPNAGAMEALLQEIDGQLEATARELDDCLQDILQTTTELPSGRPFPSPQEALNYMVNSHILEKNSCYDPELKDVTAILQHVTMLDQFPGCEEQVLEDLLMVSEQQGLSLPFRTAPAEFVSDSMASLNAVVNSNEQIIEQQWSAILMRMRRYFLDKLACLPLVPYGVEIPLDAHKRLYYLQSLVTMYPVEDVWIRYYNLRTQQIQHCFNTLLPDMNVENIDFSAITKNCSNLANALIAMIDEDFGVLCTGIFKQAVHTLRGITDIYLDKYSDEMAVLVEEICEEIHNESGKHKRAPQSNSDYGLNRIQNLKGGHAQSLDSVFAKTGAVGAAPAKQTGGVPRKYLSSLRDILLSILLIEQHIQRLHQDSSWDVSGTTGVKKTRRKSSLKGGLKQNVSPDSVRRTSNLSLGFDEANGTGRQTQADPRPPKVQRTRSEDRPKWEWRLMFKKLTPDFTAYFDGLIRDIAQSSLQEELKLWNASSCLSLIQVPLELAGGKVDYPACISKSVSDTLAEMDYLLPFAKVGSDGVMHSVRSVFVDSVNLQLKNFHVHIAKLACDISRKVPLRFLYVLLSNAAYIRNHLLHYDLALASDEQGHKLFSVLYRQFVELAESLTRQITDVNNNLIATCILHDAHSNNWAEQKEFYEEERCSFTIQMWHHHMRSLQQDLWAIAPPKAAQNILALILHRSLVTLTQRYVHIKPSFRRVNQFRSDITAILFCTSELLFPVSTSLSMYLDPGHCQLPHYSIHNLCSTLFSAMVIVAAPLEHIYRNFKKGYNRSAHRSFDSHGADDLPSPNSQWLSWIQPNLLQLGFANYADMPTTIALFFHVKMMSYQPQPSWPMTVQALLMKDYTLAILLLTQSVALLSDPDPSAGEAASAELKACVGSIFRCVVRTITICSDFPDALGRVLLPVIDRCSGWSLLESHYIPGRDFPVPIWLQTLYDYINPFVHLLLKSVMKAFLALDEKCTHPIQSVLSVMQDLPCGCPLRSIPSPTGPKTGPGDRIQKVLFTLIEEFTSNMSCLPSPVCIFFRLLQAAANGRKVKIGKGNLGIQIIASCLRNRLWNGSYIESVTGMTISGDLRDTLNMFAECAYHVLTYGLGKSSGAPRLAVTFIKGHKEWIKERVRRVVDYLGSEHFDVPETNILEGATTTFSDHLYTLSAGWILDTPTGFEDLQILHNLILNNQLWLEEQLDIAVGLPRAKQTSSPAAFSLQVAPVIQEQFNPLTGHNQIGSCSFDQIYIRDFHYDWDRILHTDLGLSRFGLQSLLFNRHELQDGAYLEESERKPVDVLRAVFENDITDLR